MFKSRRKKAIDLLKKRKAQIEKISSLTSYDRWRVRSNAIVNQYIGDNEFHRQKFAKIDLTNMPKFGDPEEKKIRWIRAQKILAKEYITSCIEYLEDGSKMVDEPNWFSNRTVAEQLAIINVLLWPLLFFTCNQGKKEGRMDSIQTITRLQSENEKLRDSLFQCISNLPKLDNSPEEQPSNEK